MNACARPIDGLDLIAYHLGELESSEAERIEEHVFSCDACTTRLEQLQRLAMTIDRFLQTRSFVSPLTVDALQRRHHRGLHVRTYTVAVGETILCTAAPEDDWIALRLRLDPKLDTHPHEVDVVAESTNLEDGSRGLEQYRAMPVDLAHGEVVLVHDAGTIRALPRTLWRITLLAAGTTHSMGEYRLDHTPWAQRP